MNAINIRSAIAFALVATLASGAASAMDPAAAENHRAEKQQRQEQRQEHQAQQGSQQNRGQDNHYANNPVPPHQDNGRHDPHDANTPVPPHQDNGRHDPHDANTPASPHQDNGRHDPHDANNPAPPPPAPIGQHTPGYYGNGHPPGYSGNGNHFVVYPPRGPQGPNYRPGSNIVPPPRNDYHAGHGYPPGHGTVYSPGYGHAPGHARPPYIVPSLPVGYHRHYWNGNPYYYGGGHWYRPYGSSYVVVGAPYGMFVPSLPYYSSFWFGSSRYYYSDGVYYNYAPARSGYVVTQSPYDHEDEQSDEVAAPDDEMYIYPAQGQSEQQQADDKYECHLWAVSQTQYDPTSSAFDAQRRPEYDRAMSACLTGRGYTVR